MGSRLLPSICVVVLLSACAEPDPAAAARAPFTVARLRCEGVEAPLGIDEPRPRFEWILDSSARGTRQSTYRVLVASTEAILRSGRADLWDSGVVASARTTNVEYAGQALRSRQRACWRVQAWNESGDQAESAIAWLETGLLQPEDWQAQWIAPVGPPRAQPAPLALAGAKWIWAPDTRSEVSVRRRFALPAGSAPVSARMVVTADDRLSAFVNGTWVAGSTTHGVLQPVDLLPHLRTGENVIAVHAQNAGGPAGVLAALQITFADGEPLAFASDAAWRCGARAPCCEQIAFDDASWAPAREVAAFGDKPWGDALQRQPLAEPSPARLLSKRFTLTKRIVRARAYASALGLYELRLNGQKVGDDVLAPGWTDYRLRVPYQTYDVTELVRGGDNALGVILADGWYAGFVGWGRKRAHYGNEPRARVQLVVEHDDGSTTVIGSDASWRAGEGPFLAADLLMGETYDARREVVGFDLPGGTELPWPCAVASETPQMSAQQGPPIRRMRELPARSVRELGGSYVFDLGQNLVGWARLVVTAPAGTRVQLRFAEILDHDGSLYTTNLRGARATDVYVCKGGGAEVFEPRFTFHGFRFVEVSGLPVKPAQDAVTGIAVHSAMRESGRFLCSSPLVNQLWQNIEWGLRGNFVGVPTDCPQRDERLGWMGDAQIFAATACLVMDAQGFFEKWLTDVVESQSKEGAFPDVAPRITHLADGAPAWADAGVIVPWAVQRAYDDRRTLRRCYPAMKRFVEFVHQHNQELLWTKKVGNQYGDWLQVEADTPKDVLATAFFARSAWLVGEAARVLGEAADARAFGELAARIRAAFVQAFVDADGRVKGGTQTAYALALRFELLPESLRARAGVHLAADVEKRGTTLTTGFVGAGHLLPALSDAGRDDLAYALLLSERYPSWGYTISNGATTIWERWDGWRHDKGFQDPGMNSFNHYSFGAVGEWLVTRVAGIEPGADGYATSTIRPRIGGDLTHASMSLDTPHGWIESSWRIAESRLTLKVRVPANTTAHVCVPAGDAALVREGGVPARAAKGVRYLGYERGVARYEVASGSYEFVAPMSAARR